ncbi:MAG TPA: pyrroloquinoline quinone biosynthesis protein PqqB [Alphaproteobacteria bacterium]|nr:pyrroloquinoline quinone biosynthesis protein PqqB [Alphaproteobacteria bacterium]HAJ48466.1 pyrroloquinoline quinone biosynthesis protein PqqB [Alphaproteobacteria bacterium]
MRIIVLGAGAGGGVPQWNANNRISSAAFRGSPAVPRLTQCSLAVSVDGERWAIFNASPDMRQQIINTKALHPNEPALRASPLSAVVLTGADVDAIAGLLTLRERQALSLFASSYVLGVLAQNPIFGVLNPNHVQRIAIEPGKPFEPLSGLVVTPFEVPGKPPLFAETQEGFAVNAAGGKALGLLFSTTDGPAKAAFIPGCGDVTADLLARLQDVALLFFDGTLFRDDELLKSGEGEKTGRRMGHMPMTGPGGSVDAFRDLRSVDKYFIHINNTNPALMRGSFERRELEAAGWRIAEDGMEFTL